MSSYTIHGVKVHFPCKAYPSQVSMMEKIIKSIDKRQNCLIESPTGSGKSLALLCSTLAWQRKQYDQIEAQTEPVEIGKTFPQKPNVFKCDSGAENVDEDFQDGIVKFNLSNADVNKKQTKQLKKKSHPVEFEDEYNDVVDSDHEVLQNCGEAVGNMQESKRPTVSKIYFATRTHKQISQIIRELNKTVYADVSMTVLSSREHTCINEHVCQSRNKNEECKVLLEASSCRYYDKVKKYFNPTQMACYGITKAWDIEDLVAYGHQIKGCPYFGARELRDSSDIIFCPYNYLIDPLIRKSLEISLKGDIVILDEAHNIEDSSREAASFTLSNQQLEDSIENINILTSNHRCDKLEDHSKLKEMCDRLMEIIEKNKFLLDDFEGGSRTWKGGEMLAELDLVALNSENICLYEKSFRKVMEPSASNEEASNVQRSKRKNDEKKKLSSATVGMLEGVLTVLSFVYKNDKKHLPDYRFVLTRSMSYSSARETDNQWMGKKRHPKSNSTWVYHLNFWCMNSAVAFVEMSRDVRSIVLTSGTLSPMNSFQSELDVPFQIQFEANHVIDSDQVLVSCLSRGPSRIELLGSFTNSERWDYQDEVGSILLDVCSIVPHGVLCFLPSYKSLEKLTSRWQMTGLFARLEKLKVVHVEPRSGGKESFEKVIRSYYEVIDRTSNDGTDGLTGALLLAICRGKVSEGIDFADNHARAVVLVSIPYPNIKDSQVNLKKEYNDMKSNKGLLSGREWYDIQAFRALNQALGRCIRHRNDWGAVILIDNRYARSQQKHISCTYLSKWLRHRVKFYDDYHLSRLSLEKFISERTNIPSNPSTSDDSARVSSSSANQNEISNADNNKEARLTLFNVGMTLSQVQNACDSPSFDKVAYQQHSHYSKSGSKFLPARNNITFTSKFKGNLENKHQLNDTSLLSHDIHSSLHGANNCSFLNVNDKASFLLSHRDHFNNENTSSSIYTHLDETSWPHQDHHDKLLSLHHDLDMNEPSSPAAGQNKPLDISIEPLKLNSNYQMKDMIERNFLDDMMTSTSSPPSLTSDEMEITTLLSTKTPSILTSTATLTVTHSGVSSDLFSDDDGDDDFTTTINKKMVAHCEGKQIQKATGTCEADNISILCNENQENDNFPMMSCSPAKCDATAIFNNIDINDSDNDDFQANPVFTSAKKPHRQLSTSKKRLATASNDRSKCRKTLNS
ncbi:hypothetical protein HELRODRAFT_189813 [Helobdella robusta]|uniref:DNA 5'-3' helicase n=1 Tax=Helobdella robusta TaxID=6412 RepID=T1FRE0_HELRO|nr:hypothetical protein HELRODRAFT_189813 [Helobdella robusta]ESN91790.1 hypothetical protein HELRODRAFT_189813 [Helobdella robusta]